MGSIFDFLLIIWGYFVFGSCAVLIAYIFIATIAYFVYSCCCVNNNKRKEI